MNTPLAPTAPPMMGDDETPTDQMAEETPTLEVSGDMAAALMDGKQTGDEFTATVKFRVGEIGDGTASLEVVDAVPQDAGAPDDSAAAIDSYLKTSGGTPPAAP